MLKSSIKVAGFLEKTRRQPLKLAESIASFFNRDSQPQQLFFDLYNACEEEIRRIVKKWSLQKVVEESQIRSAVIDFVEEMTHCPDNSPCSARLKAIFLSRKNDYLNQIQFYSSRRLFTLLKNNATANSKEYLALNNQVKKTLTRLHNENSIVKLPADFWAGRHAAKYDQGNPDSFCPSLKASLPFKRLVNEQGKITGKNLKESLLMMLSHKNNLSLKFKTGVMTTTIFNLAIDNNPPFKTSHSDTEIIETLATPECDSDLNPMARCFLEQFQQQIEKKLQQQIYLTGLACFVINFPSYFGSKDITAEHKRILTADEGEIDKIHKFLHVMPTGDLLNRVPGRSTVFNRLKSFKSLLAASLPDYTVEVQQQGIKELVKFLLDQYQQLMGGKSK